MKLHNIYTVWDWIGGLSRGSNHTWIRVPVLLFSSPVKNETGIYNMFKYPVLALRK